MQPKRVGTNERPMRGTARMRKKMQKYKMHYKIANRKWICNTDLRINIKKYEYIISDGTHTF